MPQFNAAVVNIHLADRDRQAEALRRRRVGTPLARWMANLDGFSRRNAWRYIAALEDAIAQPGPASAAGFGTSRPGCGRRFAYRTLFYQHRLKRAVGGIRADSLAEAPDRLGFTRKGSYGGG